MVNMENTNNAPANSEPAKRRPRPAMRPIAASLLAVAALATTTLAIGAAPAQAKNGEGIGSGRALVHIDAWDARVAKTGSKSYSMTISPGSTGQWMGERSDASGETRTRVGNLTAKKLAAKWANLRYTSAGVLATITWTATNGVTESALVKLGQPKVTDAGVRFDFTSKIAVPSRPQNASINLQRAPEKGKSTVRSAPEEIFNIADDLYIGYTENSSKSVSSRIFNKTNNNTCFDHTATYGVTGGSTQNTSVGTNTCDNIKYTNLNGNYGLSVNFDSSGSAYSTLAYYLTVTPPKEASFQFSYTLMQWTM